MAVPDPVVEAARTGEPDRYLAALYAPEPARSRLIALAAFAADLTRIGAIVREPLLMEIRLQWWRDALGAGQRGEATGHPVADRLAPEIASGRLPLGLLQGMIDAAARPDMFAKASDSQALKAFLSKSDGAAFLLAARALGAGHSESVDAACQDAGVAYGLARIVLTARNLSPETMALYTARSRQALAQAALGVGRLDSALLPAFLPLAMTTAYLNVAAGTPASGAMPLRRWWRLARANLSGRLA